MRIQRWLLFTLMFCLVFPFMGLTVLAQDADADNPDALPVGFVYQTTPQAAFSFAHPDDWLIDYDGPRTIYLEAQSADINVLMQILTVADERLITAFLEETEEFPDETQLLEAFFGDANFGSPRILDMETDPERQAARVGDEIEDIYLVYFSPADYFALLFVRGADRGEYEAELAALMRSLREGPPPVEFTEAGESTTVAGDFAAGSESGTLLLGEGEAQLAFAYPADWVYTDLGNVATLETEDQSVLMLLVGDLTFALDAFGGQGNPDEITTAPALIEAILAADPDLSVTPRYDVIGDKAVGTIAANDDTLDSTLIAVEVGDGQLVLLLVSTDPGQMATVDAITSAVITSMMLVP